MLGYASSAAVGIAGKSGLCIGEGKRFFSPSPFAHGLENKASQSVGNSSI